MIVKMHLICSSINDPFSYLDLYVFFPIWIIVVGLYVMRVRVWTANDILATIIQMQKKIIKKQIKICDIENSDENKRNKDVIKWSTNHWAK